MLIKHNQEDGHSWRRRRPQLHNILYGFTLIELLVVIAIISLLVSILLPSLSKAKDLAKLVTCLSNQKNLCLAGLMYANDSQNALPPVYYGTGTYSQPLRLLNSDGTRTGIGLLVNGEYVPEDITDCPGTDFVDFDENSTRRDAEGNMIMGEFIWYSNGGGYYSNHPNDVRYNATNTTEGQYANDPLVSDYFFRYGIHAQYKPHGMKTNVGYLNGAAVTIDMTDFLEDALSHPDYPNFPHYAAQDVYVYLREIHQ